jgi:HAD superfamily hydrolase (TIGR01662 family)
MRKAKGLFFDAGNTLIEMDYEFVCSVIAKEGCSVDPDFLRRADCQVRFTMDRELLRRIAMGEEIPSGTISMKAKPLLRSYFSRLLRSIAVDEAGHDRIIDRVLEEEAMSHYGLWRKVQPELGPALAEMAKRKYFLGVVSNSDGRLAKRLGLLGLQKYFTFILDSADVGIEKPDPRLFHMALRRSGIEPAESVYIGDLCSVDVLGARRVGMQGVLYDPADLYGGIEPRRIISWPELCWILNGQPLPGPALIHDS